jgi:hypothetical protein
MSEIREVKCLCGAWSSWGCHETPCHFDDTLSHRVLGAEKAATQSFRNSPSQTADALASSQARIKELEEALAAIVDYVGTESMAKIAVVGMQTIAARALHKDSK